MKRWKGRISIGVFIQESEINDFADIVEEYIPTKRIIYTVYVRKRDEVAYYQPMMSAKREFPEGIYPMNILRDLSIESIHSTHYLLIDIDIFISDTLFDSIEQNRQFLNNHYNILVFQSFQFTRYVNKTECYATGNCSDL